MGKGGEEEVKRSQERRLAPARVEEEAPVVVAGDDEERGCAVCGDRNATERRREFWTRVHGGIALELPRHRRRKPVRCDFS